jgi:hypothetical protein
MTEKRLFQLCPEKIETLEDVIKIIGSLGLRIETDNPSFEELKEYFTVEVVPPGYLKLYELVGDEIYKMSYDEIVEKGLQLLQNEKTD